MGGPVMAGRAGYHTVGKLKKLQVEYKALSDIFEKFDISGDGTISIEEYKTLCEEYGVPLTEDDIVAIRDIADADGEIHKDAFILHIKQCNLLKEFQVADPESDRHWIKKADLAFKIFDIDGDGFVSKKEFKWMTANKRISMRKVDIMFERCDLNRDGRLDYTEFKTMILRNKDRKDTAQERVKMMKRRKSSKLQELRDMKKR